MGHLTYSEIQGMGPAVYYGGGYNEFTNPHSRWIDYLERDRQQMLAEQEAYQRWQTEEQLHKAKLFMQSRQARREAEKTAQELKPRTYAERKAHRRKLVAA